MEFAQREFSMGTLYVLYINYVPEFFNRYLSPLILPTTLWNLYYQYYFAVEGTKSVSFEDQLANESCNWNSNPDLSDSKAALLTTCEEPKNGNDYIMGDGEVDGWRERK